MARFKEVVKWAATLLAVVLFVSQCSASASAHAGKDVDQSVVTVKKLALTKNDQPRVRVTTTKRIALLFSKPWSDASMEDLVHQKPGTVTYRLPKAADGTTAKWFVTAYNPKNGHELFDRSFSWRNYKRELVGLSASFGTRSTDVYAEIHPKQGGKLHVRSVRVRVISRSGNVRWLDLIHAYTDERNGTRVYVRTVRSGVAITAVDARTVYGSLQNVSASPVG